MPLLLRQGRFASGYEGQGSNSSAPVDLRLEGGRIVEIGRDLARAGSDELDIAGHLVAPGFVDLHLHGAGGVLCETADAGALRRLCQLLPRYGVTAFLATLAALPYEALRTAVATLATHRARQQRDGAAEAKILGIHLEGPFLNPDMPGAQRRDWMRAPSLEEIDALHALAGGAIRLITLAPELPGALPFITAARQRGITLSIGHTTATATQTRAAIAAGATHVTHLFNAMRPLHHREPGVVGVALTDDSISIELIADGHHVAATSLDLAWRCKPPGKRVLVTDAVALGLPDGMHQIFGARCLVAGGTIRLADHGALAGSCLSLDQAVRNLHTWLPQASVSELLAATSTNPAAVIGAAPGALVVGHAADLVILDDTLEVAATICHGNIAWQRQT